ncbi:MgtC/SapB family protein [Novosphingobium guangzhouense]|uniref:Protein MgtC n=1 Tax=Novosphingobium guangzhouense TaxID=1850347 RepID=A0A2K2G1A8_9SPHN|nr:MgtC/SapB family protein [Novosphingobium guangzhouense]PNU04839.1 MgtC/SapB family transporter [Novosphingobium guangzhouense]
MELNAPIPVTAVDAELLWRIGAAAVLGPLLGLDREMRGHAAGLRTHGLICVSAAAMTVAVVALYLQFDSDGESRMDPLRIFEATGAFVGFLGAGLIVFARGKLHNLTTAAHLWLTAVIGVACGAGLWPLVAVCVLASVLMLTLLTLIEGEWSRDRRIGARGKDDP